MMLLKIKVRKKNCMRVWNAYTICMLSLPNQIPDIVADSQRTKLSLLDFELSFTVATQQKPSICRAI